MVILLMVIYTIDGYTIDGYIIDGYTVILLMVKTVNHDYIGNHQLCLE